MMRDGFEAGPELLQKVLTLDGGLDLVTPKLLVEPGRLVDCLNYECADQVGYKKIDGFERYDGGITPSAAATNSLVTETSLANLTTYGLTAGNGAFIWWTDNPQLEVPITITRVSDGTFDSVSARTLEFTVEDSTDLASLLLARPYPETVVLLNSDRTSLVDIYSYSGTANYAILASGTLSTSLAATEVTRATIDALPLDVFPYGLQMYDNRQHVIANCRTLYFAYDKTATPIVADVPFFVNNKIRIGTTSSDFEGRILDWRFLRGDFGAVGTNDADRAWIKVLVYPTNPNGTLTTGTEVRIDREDDDFSSYTSYWTYYSAIDASGPADTTDVWGGVFYRGLVDGSTRTSNNDWEQLDMGYEVFFKSGNSSIVPRDLTLATTTAQLNSEIQTSVESPAGVAGAYSQATMVGYSNSAASFPGATTDDELITAGHDLTTANTTGVYLTSTAAIWGAGTDNTFSQFGFAIPDDVIITGITVTARCFYNSSSAVPDTYFSKVKLTAEGSTDKGSPLHNLDDGVHNTSAAAKTFTFGGANDKWGISDLTPDIVNASTFGVTMNPFAASYSTSYLFWDVLTITVHYFRPVGKIFFYDGTSELEAKLVRTHVTKGGWAAGDAEGVMHVYGIIPSASRNYIKANESLRLISGGATIGTVTSVRGSFLPSHSEIADGDSRVQMLTANYYLNPDWDTIYGCHGLGRAFSYDGVHFRKIYSAYDSQLDKPRHIASYRNYLALGYQSGNVLLSKYGESGPEPENFDPLQGAREFSFADKITGLSPLADTSLAVCCQSSINRIVLNPNAASASNLFYTAVVSSDSGAIEYTTASFGNMTLYCDQYGIRAVEQTDMQGAFIGRPLSNMVSPWLRPRLSAKKYWLDSRTAQVPLFAHSIRAKNQYRVWFSDGYVLCMNMNSAEEAPRFTFLRYGFNFGQSTFVPLTPIACSSYVDVTGTERIHIAHWNRFGVDTVASNSATLFKYVFEMEKGWSFDGQDFPARVSMNLSFLDTPFDYDQIRKIELHAADYNNTTLFAGFGTKYGEEGSYTGMTLGSTYVPAGRNAAGAIALDYTPFSKMINVATRGRPLYLKFKNSSTATGDTSASAIEPPHILQALLVQYTPARQET